MAAYPQTPTPLPLEWIFSPSLVADVLIAPKGAKSQGIDSSEGNNFSESLAPN